MKHHAGLDSLVCCQVHTSRLTSTGLEQLDFSCSALLGMCTNQYDRALDVMLLHSRSHGHECTNATDCNKVVTTRVADTLQSIVLRVQAKCASLATSVADPKCSLEMVLLEVGDLVPLRLKVLCELGVRLDFLVGDLWVFVKKVRDCGELLTQRLERRVDRIP